ncbi:hypothetical protein BA065_01640 [Nanoarchaeota archaeon NZ13-N]|uniref:Uncharacterized protein n=1 Tax=Candidatus Nanoclepta minutus TaxID=1940235 RepID=A0A397WNC7_9ARCH|nr:MAG: hypothetical protein BA065_01640 [Nanoarchaeota archaeon NZ13-N]RIB35558.1 MAG: hypothetical protein BXU00_00415 [Candidatus Nanoclepta minutus]
MAELTRIYREIIVSRKELAKLGEEKKELYEKKKQLYTEIKDLVERLKKLRQKRQEYTSTIDKLMEERAKTLEAIDKLKKEISVYDQRTKEINKNKDLIDNINKYKKELETLENVLQTEILSYSQEKKIWYRIKYLRKLLGKYEELSIFLKELDEKRKEMSALKSKLVIIGTNIKKNIEERKKIKEEIKKIKEELKKKIDEYNQIKNKITEIKQKISEIEKKMEDLLSKYVTNIEKSEDISIESKDKEEILQAYNQIQEKIMNGGEITMEEILILQKYEILKKRGII